MLKNLFTYEQKRAAYTWYYSRRYRDLTKIGLALQCSKANEHLYTPHYQRHFEHIRRELLTVMEIGIGGWGDPRNGGESLRMWKAYFPKAHIVGIDIDDKSTHNENRITTFQGSQDDEEFLRSVIKRVGRPDIIIDDGSHHTHHVIAAFEILFPMLADDGIYAIEDLQTSYWESSDKENWNGSSDLNASHTSMNYLKSLIDGLNYAEFIPDIDPNYFDKHIVGMHFYHNLCFIEKGLNDGKSNKDSVFAS